MANKTSRFSSYHLQDVLHNFFLGAIVSQEITGINRLIAYDKKFINIQKDGFPAPIFHAIENNAVKSVEILLNNGVDLNIKNKNGLTPFTFAASRPSPELFKLFIEKKVSLEDKTKLKDTALILASLNNAVENVNLILNCDKDQVKKIINLQNDQGATALIYAAAMGNLEIVKLLLDAGANTKIKCNIGKTAYEYVTEKNIYMAYKNITEETIFTIQQLILNKEDHDAESRDN